MTKEIKQTWWHIEDIYNPNHAMVIRQVFDVYTDEAKMSIPFPDPFLGIRIKGRNSPSQEIAFIWTRDGNKVNLNLDLKTFPDVFQSHNPTNINNFKHVRVEIEYTLNKPAISDYARKSMIAKFFDKIFSPKKESYLEIDGEIQPELYINLPKGWVIRENGCDIKPQFLWTDKRGIVVSRPKVDSPFIRYNQGRRNYSYYFDTGGFNSKNTSNHKFFCRYRTGLSLSILTLAVIIPFIFTILSAAMIVIDIVKITPIITKFSSSVYLIFGAIFTTYIFSYLSYVKDGYAMPFNHWHIKISILITLLTIIFGIIVSSGVVPP